MLFHVKLPPKLNEAIQPKNPEDPIEWSKLLYTYGLYSILEDDNDLVVMPFAGSTALEEIQLMTFTVVQSFGRYMASVGLPFGQQPRIINGKRVTCVVGAFGEKNYPVE
jgi:hypothetical protein